MKMGRALSIVIVGSSAFLSFSAYAEPLVFTISSNGSFVQSFQIDSEAGMDHAFGNSYTFFNITNDSSGGNAVYFQNEANGNSFGTGLKNPSQNSVENVNAYEASVPLYNGNAENRLSIGSGSNFTTDDGYDVAVTSAAVGAAPEPSAWALMILGFGVVGYAMRRRRVSFGYQVAHMI